MHTSMELRSESFAIEVDGLAATVGEVLPGGAATGRLGVVVHEPLGAVGASQLLLAAVTAFYDVQRARGENFYIYPDYYLFHVGGPHGDHSMLDVWPAHKEVVVPDEPEAILEAINDRAITWLLVPEGEPGAAPRGREARASAQERVASALSYAPAGRVEDGDVRIAGNEATDACVGAVLDAAAPATSGSSADSPADELARSAGEVGPEVRARMRASRRDLCEDGRPLETYRRLTLDAALASLGSGGGAG